MIEMSYSGNMKRRLAHANKNRAQVALLLGQQELVNGVATVRDMETGEQLEVSLSSLTKYLDQY